MGGEDAGARTVGGPFAPQRGEIGNPSGEVVDVAGDFVRAEPPRTSLAAPVGGGHPPAPGAPVLERFEVLLVGLSASGHEQQRAPHRAGKFAPVDPPDRMAVRRRPIAFDRSGRNGAAVERLRHGYLANSDLPPWLLFSKSCALARPGDTGFRCWTIQSSMVCLPPWQSRCWWPRSPICAAARLATG